MLPQARAQDAPQAPVVITARPLARHIAQWDEYTGRFEAVNRVEVRARVSGYLLEVGFRDGAFVKKGDRLFLIDPRPFQLAVDQASADVQQAAAEVGVDQADYARAATLVKTNTSSVRDLDQRRLALQKAQAQLLSAQAALKNAQLNLEWADVRAPISGRLSNRRVDPGNLVSGEGGNATLLTTIVSLDPIYFVFDASEADYLRYTRMARSGARASSRDVPNPVKLRLADEPHFTHDGVMDFVDNEIDAQTGTMRGRAIFANPDNFFTPGTFGRMRLYGGAVDALLVPDAAVISDQAQKLVFAVGPDGKIVPRPVELGGMAMGLRVITAGLKPEDQVVISGTANPMVRPGMMVDAKPGEITPAAESDP